MTARPFLTALAVLVALCCGPPLAAPSAALDLPPPARAAPAVTEALGTYVVPTGPWTETGIPGPRVEGRIRRTAWTLPLDGRTTLQLLAPLRAELTAAGWKVLYECDTDGCGGFDFRFATPVLPEPAMHVDLGDFRFLSARRDGAEGPEWISLLVSRSQSTGHVQVTEVTPASALPVPAPARPDPGDPPPPPDPAAATDSPRGAPGDIGTRLVAQGSVVLEGLAFDSGKATLAAGDLAVLSALALWLKQTPEARVTLVGHTDASGNLAANVTLSRQRADTVRRVLIDRYGVAPRQVSAEGVGPLAPRASNQTDQGRAQNRRVEAVLAPTQ